MSSPSPFKVHPLMDIVLRITAVAGLVAIFLSLLGLLTFIAR